MLTCAIYVTSYIKGITLQFHYATPTFCCAIYAKTRQTAPSNLVSLKNGAFGKSDFYRVDDAAGTVLPSKRVRHRDTSAALTFEGVEGHPVAHAWTYKQTYSLPTDPAQQPELCPMKNSKLLFDDGKEEHSLGYQVFGLNLDANKPSSAFRPVIGEELGIAEPFNACLTITNCAAVQGKIAIIQRGVCAFTTKALNVQACVGVLAIIVVNDRDGDPPIMGGDSDDVTTLIVSVNKVAGLKLVEMVKADATVEASVLCASPGLTANRLAVRVFNTFTGIGDTRVDLTPMPTLVHDDGVRKQLELRAAGSRTELVTSASAFVVVPLAYNALRSGYYKYNQFAVVYGVQRSSIPRSKDPSTRRGPKAEGIEIAFLSRASKATDPHGVHASCTLENPKFISKALDTKGLSAINIFGGIAIVWAHQFPSIDHSIVMLQIVDYNCNLMNIATAISDTSNLIAGPVRFPSISISPGAFNYNVFWTQTKGLDTDTPTEEINMRTISSNELYKTVPEGVAAELNTTEDTLLPISTSVLLANALEETTCVGSAGSNLNCDEKQSCGCKAGAYVKTRNYNNDEGTPVGNCWYCETRRQFYNPRLDRENDGSNMLTVVELTILNAALVMKEGGEPISRDDGNDNAFGAIKRSGRTSQTPGLLAEYMDGVDALVEIANTGVESFFPRTSKDQVISSLADTLNFPQDVQTIVTTLTQAPNPNGGPWPGLPHYMEKNYVARFTGKLNVEIADVYQFALDAKSAATLYIDGTPVISTRTYNFTGCRCNGFKQENFKFGGGPECNTPFLERMYCFVDRGVCSDSVASSTFPNVDYSFMACTPTISNPSEASVIVEGTGIVKLKPGGHDIALHFVRTLNDGDAYYDVKWRRSNASAADDKDTNVDDAAETSCDLMECATLQSVSKSDPVQCPVQDVVITWGEVVDGEPFYPTRNSVPFDTRGNSLGSVDLHNSSTSMVATVAVPFGACTPLDVKSDGGIMIVGTPTGVCSFATKMKHAKAAGAKYVLSVANALTGTYYGLCIESETQLCSDVSDILLLQMENKEGRRLVDAIHANASTPVTIRCNNGMPHSRFMSELEKPCCGSNFESVDEAFFTHDKVVPTDPDIQFEYVPPRNAFGTVTLEMVVASRDGPRTTGLVTINIAGINDSPTAVDDVLQYDAKGDADDVKSASNAGIYSKLTVKASDLFSNDLDLDGDPDDLQVANVTGSTNYGVVGDGDDDTIAFTYIPTTGYKLGQPYFLVKDVLRYVVVDADLAQSEASVIIVVRAPLTPCVAGETYESVESSLSSDRVCAECSACISSADEAGGLCAESDTTRCIPAGVWESEPCSDQDRVCSPLTPCTLDTQYEVTAPEERNGTFTSDRTCSDLTVCSVDEYVAEEPTGTSNRVCKQFTECGDVASAYETKAPVPTTSDRECAARSTCTAGELVADSGNSTTDRTCTACKQGTFTDVPNADRCSSQTRCSPGEYIGPDSIVEARTCTACDDGLFQDDDTHQLAECKVPTTCPGSTFIEVDVTAVADQTCKLCDGVIEYQNLVNQPTCKTATVCKVGEETDIGLTRSSDRECRSCIAGETFQNKAAQAKCKPVSNCKAGKEESKAPTVGSNRVCNDCSPGFYQNEPGQLKCKAITDCGKGREQSVPQTTETNRECRVCDNLSFQPDEGTHPCKLLTVCGAGQEQATASKPSVDRTCRECEDGEFKPDDGNVDCSNHRLCAVGEEVDVEPTATEDRTCRPCIATKTFQDQAGQQICKAVTVCKEGEEQVQAPTASRDRACASCKEGSTFQDQAGSTTPCKRVTICRAGFEQKDASTVSSDRTCSACKGGAYQDKSNQVRCKLIQECGRGAEEFQAQTATKDRVCNECNAKTYQPLVGTHPCLPATVCPSGEEQEYDVTATLDRQCKACGEGKYKSQRGQNKCNSWKTCGTGTGESNTPSASANRICSGCIQGINFQKDDKNSQPCKPLLQCSVGEEEATTPTASSDRSCQSCTLGATYQPEPNQTTCLPLTRCSVAFSLLVEYESTAATFSTDRVCTPFTVCSADNEYQSSPPSALLDRVCLPISPCKAGEFEVEPPSRTSNRVCQTHTQCDTTEFEVIEPTLTNDRVCDPLRQCINNSTHIVEFESKEPSATEDRECTAVTVCNTFVDEYESKAPSTTSNRDCTPLSLCNALKEYESEPPTTFADRSCAVLSTCNDEIEFQGQRPSYNTDRICINRDVCSSSSSSNGNGFGFFLSVIAIDPDPTNCRAVSKVCDYQTEFEAFAPTLGADRVCQVTSVCEPGQFESVVPTATSDRECLDLATCLIRITFEIAAPTFNSNRICVPTTNCTADDDEYEETPATLTTDRVCSEIKKCDFKTTLGVPYPTSGSTFELEPPTLTSDRVCQEIAICADWTNEFYNDPYTDRELFKLGAMSNSWDDWKELLDGTFSETGIPYNQARSSGMDSELFYTFDLDDDLVLTELEIAALKIDVADGTISTASRGPWVQAPDAVLPPEQAIYYQKVAPTATSNAQCEKLRLCSAAEYEVKPATMLSDRECEPLFDCTAGSYVAVLASPNSDRVCAPCNEGTYALSYNTYNCTTVLDDERAVQAFALDTAPTSILSNQELVHCAKTFGTTLPAMIEKGRKEGAGGSAGAGSNNDASRCIFQLANDACTPTSLSHHPTHDSSAVCSAIRESRSDLDSVVATLSIEFDLGAGKSSNFSDSAASSFSAWIKSRFPTQTIASVAAAPAGLGRKRRETLRRWRVDVVFATAVPVEVMEDAVATMLSSRIIINGVQTVIIRHTIMYIKKPAAVVVTVAPDGNTTTISTDGPSSDLGSGSGGGAAAGVVISLLILGGIAYYVYRRRKLEEGSITSDGDNAEASDLMARKKNRMSMYENPAFKTKDVITDPSMIHDEPTRIEEGDIAELCEPAGADTILPPQSRTLQQQPVTVLVDGGGMLEAEVPVDVQDAELYEPTSIITLPPSPAQQPSSNAAIHDDGEVVVIPDSDNARLATTSFMQVVADDEVGGDSGGGGGGGSAASTAQPPPLVARRTPTSEPLSTSPQEEQGHGHHRSGAHSTVHMYHHGPIDRATAEARLRDAGSWRYLFRAKGASTVLSVRYVAGGAHKVQHSLLSESSPGVFLLDNKPFDDVPPGAMVDEALGIMVAVKQAALGRPIFPVRDFARRDNLTLNPRTFNAQGGYQNTSWEVMAAFISELPTLDRATAEHQLTAAGVNGGFLLRQKNETTVVASCIYQAKYVHVPISLVEDLDKVGAKWVFKGMPLREQTLWEAARSILVDTEHVTCATWIGEASEA